LPTSIQTPRGAYLLTVVGEPERSDSSVAVTLSVERADGFERFGLRCAARAPRDSHPAGAIVERLSRLIERNFEQVREAALKSIRTEGKLLQIDLESGIDGGGIDGG
jgi:hypothetical protein